ncbi:MAG: 50S ribosome-binding GTPase [Candidatus Lokiarchaeota archaeon]|nr:50S ribosome-binding GTPase [Candidatus Lokiarchaeota archaeon]
MTIQYLTKDEKKKTTSASKLLFTGLDNAGKTTIIYALQREFSKIAFLKPTRGAQRRIFEFMGKEIAEWDLGGQISYRISYLKNPGKYFDDTEIVVYVIDVQNRVRIPESISYLKDVVEQFRKLEIAPPMYIFLHKYDPALRRNALNEMKNLELEIKEKIKKSVEYKEIYYYNTSIYDLPSIIKAMSEILLNIYPKSELIEKTIIEFGKKTYSDGIVLLDDNSLIVGSFYKDDETKNLLAASTPYFLSLNDSFVFTEVQPSREQEENHMVVQRYGRNFIFKQLSFKEGVSPYYILMLKQDTHLNKEDIDCFSNLLKEILYA